MKRMKVEGHSDLERDLYSNALVNTDSDAYNAFIQRVNEKMQGKND